MLIDSDPFIRRLKWALQEKNKKCVVWGPLICRDPSWLWRDRQQVEYDPRHDFIFSQQQKYLLNIYHISDTAVYSGKQNRQDPCVDSSSCQFVILAPLAIILMVSLWKEITFTLLLVNFACLETPFILL